MRLLEAYPLHTLPRIVDAIPKGLPQEKLQRVVANVITQGHRSFMQRCEVLIRKDRSVRYEAWRKEVSR